MTATCLAHAFVFLEGLPTITAIVEGFGGVPSYNTPNDSPWRPILVFIIIKVYSINLIQ